MVVADKAVRVLRNDIVAEDEAVDRLPVGFRDVARGKNGVVYDNESVPLLHRHELPVAAPLRPVDVVEDVIANRQVMPALPFRAVDIHGAARAAHDVVDELNVADGRLRRVLLLVAHGEEQSRAVLSARPVVCHQVAVHQDALRVLQLELILDHPTFGAPTQRLVEMVAAHDDVGRDDAHARRRAAEENALRGGLYVVVRYLERAVAAPAADRLTLVALALNVGEVAVHYSYRAPVGGDAAPLPIHRIAVNVRAIKFDVVRQLVGRLLFAVAEQDDVALASRSRPELHADEAVVVRARGGRDRGRARPS